MAIKTLFLAILIRVRRLLSAFSIVTYTVYFRYLEYNCYAYYLRIQNSVSVQMCYEV